MAALVCVSSNKTDGNFFGGLPFIFHPFLLVQQRLVWADSVLITILTVGA